MKLITQENFNECGVCCVNMLINHYNDDDQNLKPQLLNNCMLTKNGLNILELEQLCAKYKIDIDSYEMNYEELISSKTKNPMILILKRDGYFHYVVGIIENKKIKIFDPGKNVYVIKNKNDFIEWTGYVCFSKAKKFKLKLVDLSLPLIKNINIVIVLGFLFINIFEYCFSLSLSWLMSKIINLQASTVNNDSLWKLGFIFIVFVILQGCFTFLNQYLKTLYLHRNFKNVTTCFLLQLVNKNFYFFECYNKQQILQFWEFHQKLFIFYSFYWSDLISQVLLNIASCIILLMISVNLWFVLCLIIFVKVILSSLKFRNEFNLQTKLINEKVKIENTLHNLLDTKAENFFVEYELKVVQNINSKLLRLRKDETNTEIKNYFLNLSIYIFETLLTFTLIILLWKNATFSVGKLFLLLSTLNMFNTSFDQNLESVRHYFQIRPIYKILLNFISTNNVVSNDGIKLSNPKTITWKKYEFKKSVLIDTKQLTEHPLIKELLNEKSANSSITINGLSIKNYDRQDLNKKIILINHNFCLYKEDVINLMSLINNYEAKSIIGMLRNLNLQEFNFTKLEPELKIIIVLFYLQTQQDCIICLNNFFNTTTNNETFWNKCNELLLKININNLVISNNVPIQLMNNYEYQI